MTDMEIGNSLNSINYQIKQENKTLEPTAKSIDSTTTLIELDSLMSATKGSDVSAYNKAKIEAIKEQIMDTTYPLNLTELVDMLMIELMTSETI